MSQDGHGGIVIRTARLPGGVAFDWHEHPVHQLAWADTGVLTVATAEGTWVLPPSRALWIPTGVRHAIAKACGTEWVTGMNSTSNDPIRRRSPSATVLSLVRPSRPPSSMRWRASPSVSAEPNSGNESSRNRYDSAPT